MNEATKRAIDKLKIIKDISDSAETRQLCKILVEWLSEQEKTPMGFAPKKDE